MFAIKQIDLKDNKKVLIENLSIIFLTIALILLQLILIY